MHIESDDTLPRFQNVVRILNAPKRQATSRSTGAGGATFACSQRLAYPLNRPSSKTDLHKGSHNGADHGVKERVAHNVKNERLLSKHNLRLKERRHHITTRRLVYRALGLAEALEVMFAYQAACRLVHGIDIERMGLSGANPPAPVGTTKRTDRARTKVIPISTRTSIKSRGEARRRSIQLIHADVRRKNRAERAQQALGGALLKLLSPKRQTHVLCASMDPRIRPACTRQLNITAKHRAQRLSQLTCHRLDMRLLLLLRKTSVGGPVVTHAQHESLAAAIQGHLVICIHAETLPFSNSFGHAPSRVAHQQCAANRKLPSRQQSSRPHRQQANPRRSWHGHATQRGSRP